MKFIFWVALCCHFAYGMTHVEKYVGYDIEERYHPAFAYALTQSQVLKNMRLNGLYGSKECCPNPHWRQSTFESFRAGDFTRNAENSLSYPMDSVAAFIQWFFPSAGRTLLEPNINSHDVIGEAVKCLMNDKQEGLDRLAVLLKNFNDLTIYDDALKYPDVFFERYLAKKDLKAPRKEILLDIMVHAVKSMKKRENAIYFDHLLEYVFVSFLTQILHTKEDLLYVFKKAGIKAEDKFYFILDDLTRSEYDEFKMHPLSLEDIVIAFEYHKKYEQVLPPFLRYEHSFVSIDGDDICFADCGETAFLNFCLCFLWEDNKINSNRWAALKERYPTFAPFVEFFEQNQTLDQIKKNRSQWAILMAFKEWQGVKPKYNRRNQAEIIGGNQSFLNLMSILFKEDAIMQQPFKGEKLLDPEDQKRAKLKWKRLLDILNVDQNIAFEKQDFVCKNDLNIDFVKAGSKFTYSLGMGHFSIYENAKTYSHALLHENYKNHPLLSLFSNEQRDCDMEYFWYSVGLNSHSTRGDFFMKIPFNHMATIIMRRLMGNHLGAMDDAGGILWELKTILSNLYPTLSIYEQFLEMLKIPICQEYFFKYFVLHFMEPLLEDKDTFNSSFIQLLSDQNPQLKPLKDRSHRLFKELAESQHPQRYKVLAYYDQVRYIQYIFKRSHHPDYATLFSGKINENHPFFYALMSGAENVFKIYAPLTFWKVYKCASFDNRLYVLVASVTKNGSRFIIDHYPDILLFDADDEEKSVRQVLNYVPYPNSFQNVWAFYQNHNPERYTSEWLTAPYENEMIPEDYLDDTGKTNIVLIRFCYSDSDTYHQMVPFIKTYGKPKCIQKKFMLYFLDEYRHFECFKGKPELLLTLLDYIDVFDLVVLNAALSHPESIAGSEQYNAIMERAPKNVVEEYHESAENVYTHCETENQYFDPQWD